MDSLYRLAAGTAYYLDPRGYWPTSSADAANTEAPQGSLMPATSPQDIIKTFESKHPDILITSNPDTILWTLAFRPTETDIERSIYIYPMDGLADVPVHSDPESYHAPKNTADAYIVFAKGNDAVLLNDGNGLDIFLLIVDSILTYIHEHGSKGAFMEHIKAFLRAYKERDLFETQICQIDIKRRITELLALLDTETLSYAILKAFACETFKDFLVDDSYYNYWDGSAFGFSAVNRVELGATVYQQILSNLTQADSTPVVKIHLEHIEGFWTKSQQA